MDTSALAKLFYQAAEKVWHTEMGAPEKADSIYKLLNALFVEVTKTERLQFTTLFSRIAYVSQQHRFPRRLQYYIHHFRKAQNRPDRQGQDVEHLLLGIKALLASVEILLGEAPTGAMLDVHRQDWPLEFRPVALREYRAQCRVVVLDDYHEERKLLIKDEAEPDAEYYLAYDLPDRNENFNTTVELIREVFPYPVVCQLIDVEIGADNIYRPRAMVIEPDYLMDVSSVAESFKPEGSLPELMLLKKYLPFTVSQPLMLGNIANFFLDELMRREDAGYRETFVKVFRLFPLVFCLLPDREVRTIMQSAQKHFVNLKNTIRQQLPQQQIDTQDAYLEPSFYGVSYGLQGRLDVLARGERTAIIELKSGKIFRPNVYGINVNHYTQTLLYDLIIRDVFGRKADPVNFILYSGADDNQLRFAPVVRAQQFEALNVRNQMLAMEWHLQGLGCNEVLGTRDWIARADLFFRRLRPEKFPQSKGFVRRDLEQFSQFYAELGAIEKRYFIAFSGMIAREHRLAKTGDEAGERANGQANLWLNAYGEKEEHFAILAQLQLREQYAATDEPLLTFRRSEQTNPLANFRNGDIAVLYPYRGEEVRPVANQVFKCTILELNQEEVVVRLRSPQFNDQLFQAYEYWNLEPDLFDSSFNNMYRNLYAFLQAPERKRKLLLGLVPPKVGEPLDLGELPAELTGEQQQIFRKLLASEDYFLLWGPPGTGKTSVMLKHLTGYLLDHTDENIILLAYTNRAVDEMCTAIEAYHPDMGEKYLRIGSRYSCPPRFRDRLLSVQTERLSTRKELTDLIRSHRIFIGTVASVAGKPELFQLVRFHRAIIDEASQVLEPYLVGLLPAFDHFTLIGDHKQLPAVVTQAPEISAVEDPMLQQIGLSNLRNSLFERLFKLCVRENWDHAYAQLSHQGRMHREIMAFPNSVFYGGRLNILPAHIDRARQQEAPIRFEVGAGDALSARLARQRVLFFPTGSRLEEAVQKNNREEARLTVRLIRAFEGLYQANQRPFSWGDIGVITPFRAQIAMIRQTLDEADIPADQITIDTVERYQGGARNIIIISLCTNSLTQLNSMISLSEEGVDRKLNVALTRAREHLILLGNPDLLRRDPIYRQLLEFLQQEG